MSETIEERLTVLAADLINARDQAKWGGSEIAVRVVAPNVLIARIVDARDEISKLKSQLEEARAKAIEECAQVAANFATLSFDPEHAHPNVETRFHRRDAAFEIEKDIRALIAGSTK